MTLTRLLALNTLAQYLGKALSIMASIIVTSLLTSRLGVQGYGHYVYVFSLTLLFFSLADWGSTFVSTRLAAAEPQRQSHIYSTTILFRLAVSFLITLAFVSTSFLYPTLISLRPLVLVASLLLPLMSLKTSFQVIFQTKLQLWRLSLVDTISSLTFPVFLFLLHPSSFDATNVFGLLVLSTLISVFAGLYSSLRLTSLPLHLELGIAKSILLQSLPMGTLLTVFSIYNRLDILILERLQGSEAVAYYGLSYKVYESLVVGAGFLANATFPILAARAKQTAQFRAALEKNLAALLLLSFIVAIPAFFLSPFIISFLAGSTFSPSILTLRLLSLSIIPSYLNHAIGYPLLALNKQHKAAITAILALFLNASLNLLLIPHFSILASAAITGVTEVFVLILNTRLLLKSTGRLSITNILFYLHPKTIFRLLFN